MEHIAILSKSKISSKDDLLLCILNKSKTIESRWYVNKISPWNKIKKGETVYFKRTGEPVIAKCTVSKVLQYEDLDKSKISKISEEYSKQISPYTTKKEFKRWALKQVKKRYCILVFLSNVQSVDPFNISKKGFGISSAWLSLESVDSIRIRV